MSGHDCDCLIIGAGPAGASLASLLARRGLSVIVCDRAQFPRPKVCGGCLNAESLTGLKKIGVLEPVMDCGALPTNSIRLFCGRKSFVLNIPDGLAISRLALDEVLVRHARDCGAEVRENTHARVEIIERDCVRVSLKVDGHPTEEISAAIVVVAGGLGSRPLARDLEWEEVMTPHSRIGAGVLLESDYGVAPGEIIMHVSRHGYVGLVRVENGRLNIGAALAPDRVKTLGGSGPAMEEILRECGMSPAPPLSGKVSAVPALTRRLKRVSQQRLFVIGDAAGYVEPFTGQGMAWALRTALLVAPLVEKAAKNWHPGMAEEWQMTYTRHVARDQRKCLMLSRLLRRPGAVRLLASILSTAPWAVTPLVHAFAPNPTAEEVTS